MFFPFIHSLPLKWGDLDDLKLLGSSMQFSAHIVWGLACSFDKLKAMDSSGEERMTDSISYFQQILLMKKRSHFCLIFPILSHSFLNCLLHVFLFADARVRGWFLLDSYLPTFFLTGAYLLCIWLGNKFMKNRPPFSLRPLLIVYNLGITLLSFYMLIEVSALPGCKAEEGDQGTVFSRSILVAGGFARKV